MATNTPNYNLILPEVGSDVDVWGGMLNTNWTDTDVILKAQEDVATQNTADIAALVNMFYPVGAINITIDDVNPSTRLAGTTWVLDSVDKAVIGAGGTHIGGADVGADTATLIEANLPPHVHNATPPSATTNSKGSHTHALANGGQSLNAYASGGITGWSGGGAYSGVLNQNPSAAGNHTHTVDIDPYDTDAGAGVSTPVDVVQASRAFYIWRRTV